MAHRAAVEVHTDSNQVGWLDLPRENCTSYSLPAFLAHSRIGQTEKNSVRVYVFRFTLKLGHCSTQPGTSHLCRFCCKSHLRWASKRDSVVSTRIATRSIDDGPSEE